MKIKAPPENWCQALRRQFPEASIRIRMVVPTSAAQCLETVTIRGADVGAVIEACRNHPHVAHLMVMDQSHQQVQLRLTIKGCPVADVLRTTGVAPRLPFTVEPGGDVWLLMGQAGAVGQARKRLEASGLATRVVDEEDWSGRSLALTDHQHATLTAAVQQGYYDYPRRTSLTALAGHLGVTKSTLCQSLMMIEKKIMASHLEADEVVESDAPRR